MMLRVFFVAVVWGILAGFFCLFFWQFIHFTIGGRKDEQQETQDSAHDWPLP